MIIGLKPGTLGAVVERLHRVLTSIGHRIEPGETERSEFGPSTLDALHSFQNQRGLPVSDEVDASTHAVLLDVEKNITINVVEATSPPLLPPLTCRTSTEGPCKASSRMKMARPSPAGVSRPLRSISGPRGTSATPQPASKASIGSPTIARAR